MTSLSLKLTNTITSSLEELLLLRSHYLMSDEFSTEVGLYSHINYEYTDDKWEVSCYLRFYFNEE
jgi:hypothetical protein